MAFYNAPLKRGKCNNERRAKQAVRERERKAHGHDMG